MDGHHQVPFRGEPEFFKYPGLLLSDPPVILQCIDHHVPDKVHPSRDPLVREVPHGGACRAEEEVGDVIGRNPVDLFGHTPIEAPEARLHVGDRGVEFGSREGTGQGGVRVAEDNHHVRLLFEQHLLDAGKDLAGLLPVRTGSHPEMIIRFRYG